MPDSTYSPARLLPRALRPIPRLTLFLCLLLARAGLLAEEPAPAAAPTLTEATYATLRAQIATTPGEGAWREVGWLPTFGDALAEARLTRKPVFLWAMNGHPLACV